MKYNLTWHTERTSFGYNHKGDESNFEKTYKSLIKESAQNSLDALDSKTKKESPLFNYKGDHVDIEFQIIELSGEAKKLWREAIDFDNSYKKFADLLEKTLKPEEGAGPEIMSKQENLNEFKNARKLVASEKPIYLLNIIDTNTVGLDGPDKKTKGGEHRRFASLFRSTKEPTKGKGAGSWGLGKNSFTNASHLGMFLTCSNPKDLKSSNRNVDDKLRIYGMSINNQAQLENVEEGDYLSSYWNFGETKQKEETTSETYDTDIVSEFPITNWSKSSWNNKDAAQALQLDQLSNNNGTVVQIPVLKTEEFGKDNILENITKEISNQCSLWLWPAILSGKMNVKITKKIIKNTSSTNKTETIDISKEFLLDNELVKPYCEIFNQIQTSNEIPTELDEATKYLKVESIKYLIPTEKNEAYDKREIHNPHLYLNFLPIDERNNEELINYRNTVALVRAPGIVLDYEKIDPRREKIVYTGVLFAGVSYKLNAVNLNAENFLRLAENPSHNSWWPDKRLNKLNVFFNDDNHDWGSTKLRNQLRKPLVNTIQYLFAESTKSSGNRNKWMENMFVIKNPPKPKPNHDIIAKRHKQNIIRVTVKLQKEETLCFDIEDAQVMSILDNEVAGKVKVNKILAKDSKPFHPQINRKNMLIEKMNNRLYFRTNEKGDSFTFDLILDKETRSNISYNKAKLKLNYKPVDHTDWRRR